MRRLVDLAVAERDDQILGGDVGTAFGGRNPRQARVAHVVEKRSARRALRLRRHRRTHAWIVQVVLNVDDAVAVEIVRSMCVAPGVLRIRQLRRVQPRTVLQFAARGDAPVDPTFHVCNEHIIASAVRVRGAIPQRVDVHARRSLGIGRRAGHVLRYAAEQVPRLTVPRGTGLTVLRGCVVRIIRIRARRLRRARRSAGQQRAGQRHHPSDQDQRHERGSRCSHGSPIPLARPLRRAAASW